MNADKIKVICGDCGSGKTALAIGKAMQVLTEQKQVIMIQFLKGRQSQEHLEIWERLEPELKIFRFEKAASFFEDLTEEEKEEERINIYNGLNYAKKVLSTGECDLLILDEILGVVDQKIISADDLLSLLECGDGMDVILTGRILPEKIEKAAGKIMRVVIH